MAEFACKLLTGIAGDHNGVSYSHSPGATITDEDVGEALVRNLVNSEQAEPEGDGWEPKPDDPDSNPDDRKKKDGGDGNSGSGQLKTDDEDTDPGSDDTEKGSERTDDPDDDKDDENKGELRPALPPEKSTKVKRQRSKAQSGK